MTHGSLVSNVAAMMGNTAFLAPLTVTSPHNGTPPLIKRLSMKNQFNKQIQHTQFLRGHNQRRCKPLQQPRFSPPHVLTANRPVIMLFDQRRATRVLGR
jgi:hypothetical protein